MKIHNAKIIILLDHQVLTERGEMLSYSQMWSALNRIVEQAREAGLELPPKLAWHSLRKSFATNYRSRKPLRYLGVNGHDGSH